MILMQVLNEKHLFLNRRTQETTVPSETNQKR